MNSIEAKQWVNANAKLFPIAKAGLVVTSLERMSDTSYRAATSQKFKSPAVAFILAFFLPGFDQFYLGKIGAGLLQILLLDWITLGIYPIVRWFKVCNDAREVNVSKITAII